MGSRVGSKVVVSSLRAPRRRRHLARVLVPIGVRRPFMALEALRVGPSHAARGAHAVRRKGVPTAAAETGPAVVGARPSLALRAPDVPATHQVEHLGRRAQCPAISMSHPATTHGCIAPTVLARGGQTSRHCMSPRRRAVIHGALPNSRRVADAAGGPGERLAVRGGAHACGLC